MSPQLVWRQPPETYSSEWIDSFDAMQSLREAVLADDELSQRLDVMVGTEFWRTGRVLADVVIYRLLAPMVLSTRTYRFERDRLDELYRVLEQAWSLWLLAVGSLGAKLGVPGEEVYVLCLLGG